MNQPRPTENELSQDVLPEVYKDLEARKRKGLESYGTTLKTFNGRSALRDAYEEALDMVMYLKQALMEQEAPMAEFKRKVESREADK